MSTPVTTNDDDTFYRVYPVATCEEMIAHYAREAVNWTKPETWHRHARLSLAEWRWQLERALGNTARGAA